MAEAVGGFSAGKGQENTRTRAEGVPWTDPSMASELHSLPGVQGHQSQTFGRALVPYLPGCPTEQTLGGAQK